MKFFEAYDARSAMADRLSADVLKSCRRSCVRCR